jgi:peptidoglycan/xylan/chitin deacetylase (PgdA/CDA1 family)
VKQPVKRALGRSLFASSLAGLFLKSRAVVVAFHRVKDGCGDEPLTVDVATFERYCRFFKSYFRVTPLHEIVDRLEHGESLNGELAITFDDGYRDNYENAAPVLERLALPATFFVVTNWIGTDVVPAWDRAHGVHHPWMTWHQLRSLHHRGFDIGAHTRTHVDLGTVDEFEAESEVLGARRDLEWQLDAPVHLFAYPYGRRENLCDRNRAVVKACGFRCCCSCFGGVVAEGCDPFQISRIPVSPRCPSPDEFAFELALGRSILHDGADVPHHTHA